MTEALITRHPPARPRRRPILEARQAFERLITPLRAAARAHSYALAVHGSLARDIDLIAVPWELGASEAPALIEALRACTEEILGGAVFIINDLAAGPRDYVRRSPEPKPHGRLGWSIYIGGAPFYLDVSVMPIGGAFIPTYPQYDQPEPWKRGPVEDITL